MKHQDISHPSLSSPLFLSPPFPFHLISFSPSPPFPVLCYGIVPNRARIMWMDRPLLLSLRLSFSHVILCLISLHHSRLHYTFSPSRLKGKVALSAQTDLRDINTEVKEMNKTASELSILSILIFSPSILSLFL